MTSKMLRDVFNIDADVIPDPRTGAPLCLPYGLAEEHVEATAIAQPQTAVAKNNYTTEHSRSKVGATA